MNRTAGSGHQVQDRRGGGPRFLQKTHKISSLGAPGGATAQDSYPGDEPGRRQVHLIPAPTHTGQ